MVDRTEGGRIHRTHKNLIDVPEFVTSQTGCQLYDGKQLNLWRQKMWNQYSACGDKHIFNRWCLALEGKSFHFSEVAPDWSASLLESTKVNQNIFNSAKIIKD